MTDRDWREREQARLIDVYLDREYPDRPYRARRLTVIRGPRGHLSKDTPKSHYAALQARRKADAA